MRVPAGPSTKEIRVVGLNWRGSIVNTTPLALSAFAATSRLRCPPGDVIDGVAGARCSITVFGKEPGRPVPHGLNLRVERRACAAEHLRVPRERGRGIGHSQVHVMEGDGDGVGAGDAATSVSRARYGSSTMAAWPKPGTVPGGETSVAPAEINCRAFDATSGTEKPIASITLSPVGVARSAL